MWWGHRIATEMFRLICNFLLLPALPVGGILLCDCRGGVWSSSECRLDLYAPHPCTVPQTLKTYGENPQNKWRDVTVDSWLNSLDFIEDRCLWYANLPHSFPYEMRFCMFISWDWRFPVYTNFLVYPNNINIRNWHTHFLETTRIHREGINIAH